MPEGLSPPGDVSLPLCFLSPLSLSLLYPPNEMQVVQHQTLFPFGNGWLPPEPKRTYCFQKISKRQSASGWNGPPFAFSGFYISRDDGTQHGASVLKEIPSLTEDGDYFKALTFYRCDAALMEITKRALRCQELLYSWFHLPEDQESERSLHIRSKKVKEEHVLTSLINELN